MAIFTRSNVILFRVDISLSCNLIKPLERKVNLGWEIRFHPFQSPHVGCTANESDLSFIKVSEAIDSDPF